MFYFIPSWYNSIISHEKWGNTEQPWYRGGNSREFDDTVHQLRMFLDAGEMPGLICLAYMPTMRRILHRMGLGRITPVSVFDRLQDVHSNRIQPFSFMDLEWPEEIEWSYNPFTVIGYLEGRQYVRLEFGQEGYLLYADYYAPYNGQGTETERRVYFDDRGFVSSELKFENGNAVSHSYFSPMGEKRATHCLKDNTVELYGNAVKTFGKRVFPAMEELLVLIMKELLGSIVSTDTVVVAADDRHGLILQLAVSEKDKLRIGFSFFEDRMDLSDNEDPGRRIFAYIKDNNRPAFVVADTEEAAEQLHRIIGGSLNIYEIPPFDARLSLGRSQRVRAQRIFLPADGLESGVLEKTMRQVLAYMLRNTDAELILGTRNSNHKESTKLRDYAENLLETMEIRSIHMDKPSDTGNDLSENALILGEDAGENKPRIFIMEYSSEQDLIRILKDVRMIVDVSPRPDLYLQIAGISAGIPQVNLRSTRYVEHKKDGYILESMDQVTEALCFYLGELQHWNESLVYCVQLARKYTGPALVEKWKELSTDNGE